MKKVKFKYNGKTKTIEETSHAALFREFFAYWKELDLQQAIFGTFESGLRLSDDEYFEGTVIKKKNLEVAPDLYIITHITPQAMDKGLFGFLDAVGAEVLEPKRPVKKSKTDKPQANDEEEDEPEDEIIPQTQEEIMEAIKALAQGDSIKTKKNDKTVNMSDLVRAKMKERDSNIKARLAKGNK
jgi:hypothetical protein